jgi:hypothetical protein
MIFLLYLFIRWMMILVLAIVIFAIGICYLAALGIACVIKLVIEAAEESPPNGGRTIPQARWSNRR